jgi:hypothetical protein
MSKGSGGRRQRDRGCIDGVTGEAPEWPSDGRRLTANGLGGGGDDGELISRGGRAREGQS